LRGASRPATAYRKTVGARAAWGDVMSDPGCQIHGDPPFIWPWPVSYNTYNSYNVGRHFLWGEGVRRL